MTVNSGAVGVFVGAQNAGSHQLAAVLHAGESMSLAGGGADQLISVQSEQLFTVTIAISGTPPPTTTTPPTTTVPPQPACTDPVTCGVVDSKQARWRCVLSGCTAPDWTGAVIDWPSWAAYSTNNRAGTSGRKAFDTNGVELFPYMGPWADGCEITAVSGLVVVIEWERGTNVWRGTYVQPGQTHVIDLISPENNVIIETEDAGPNFKISLSNCDPQPLP